MSNNSLSFDLVLHSDYTTGLSYLMKYPTNIDVMLIIRHSLHMLAPDVSDLTNMINNFFLKITVDKFIA